MRSSCPSCLSQIEHSQSEIQITCKSCGEVYSPFMTTQDSASHENSPTDFTESALAFQEIVDFGQSIDQVSAPSVTGVRQEAPKSTAVSTQEFILSTADLGAGLRVVHWYSPLARITALGDNAHLLDKAFQELREEAEKLGANAVIGIRCSITADNKRALVTGTAVRCEKTK